MAGVVRRAVTVAVEVGTRATSTAGVPSTASAAAAAVAASKAPAVKPLSSAEAANRGIVVTPSWMRFSVGTSSRGFTVAEMRKVTSLSMVTESVAGRRAVVYRVSPNAMSSGAGASRWWAVRMNHVDKWANPLMGWLSSADTMAPLGMHSRFESAEAAVAFCIRNRIPYEVAAGASSNRTPGRVDNQYAHNFLSKEVSTLMARLGARKARAIFANPQSGADHWVNLRRSTFGPDPWKPASYQTTAAWTGPAWPATVKVKPAGGH